MTWTATSGDIPTTYTYDALNRLSARGTTTYAYNGDGTLVSQLTGGVTTRYTQDLAAPLSQVLQIKIGSAPITDYLYGLNRLALLNSGVKTWYAADALGSVRRTVADSGTPLGIVNYDPWGTPESGAVPTFGFTGEIQDPAAGLVNLRARWYSTAKGTFTSVDPFAGFPEQPYSLHQYQYGYSDPVLNSDPSGAAAKADNGGGGRSTNPCERITDQQAAFLCKYNRRMQGSGAQHGQGDDNNYECIGNPGAVEVRLPLADGGTAPACLNAPTTEFERALSSQQRKPKQPAIIVDPLGNLVCADDDSASQDEEEPAQLGQSSFLPDLGIPTPPGWLKKLRRGLDGFLRPTTLRNPKTWQEAEDMIGKFTGVRPNRGKGQVKLPVPGEGRNRTPDFIGPDWLGESKWLVDTAELQLRGQQRDVAKIAQMPGKRVPYYVFVTEGKPIDPKLVRLLRDTGGDIIIFFKQP